MKTKKLLNIFTAIGALITVLASAWWGGIYYFVSKMNGENMWSSFNCLYSLGPDCSLLRSMMWLRGINGYEPLLFWLGITVLLISLLVKSSLQKELNNNQGGQS